MVEHREGPKVLSTWLALQCQLQLSHI